MRKTTKSRPAIAAALLVLAAAAHADNAQQQARNGAVADGVSSAVAIATGTAAVNPLLPVVGLGFKAATFHYAESLPETERPGAYAFAAATWQGTAAGNLCLTASVLTGGSFLPGCVAVGMAWGVKTWGDSARERRLSERCAVLRDFVGKPHLPCEYFPRGLEEAESQELYLVSAQELTAP